MSDAYVLGLVGDRSCEHADWTYYHSSLYEDDPYERPDGTIAPPGTGIYACCGRCGLHVWNTTAPEGVEVHDTDYAEEDEEDEHL